MEDITERKEAEIALQQASLELAISRHALQRIIQQLPIGIQTFTPDGLCSDVNQAHLTLFGLHSREQLVGRYNIFNDPLAIITGTHAAAQRALAGETVYMGDVHFYFEQFRTQWAGHDKMRVINVTILPIIDQHGSVVNIVGLNQDVTERYQSEQQHLQILVQGERIKLLENLIRDISHDLRTPLTIIGTCLYLIRKTSTPDQQKYVERIEFQVSRLVKLIDGLLTMSRLDQAASLHMKPINLATLVRNLVEAQMISAQDNQVKLILEVAQRDLYIQGDEDELNHALHHLVENGITFTPGEGEVRVKAWGDLESIYVEVRDTGVGIDPEDLPHIFERFYRADKARATDTGGSGLGLAIAKRVIEMHQGRIEAFSQPNQGSRFVVTLPRS
jgi:PAS domain S-box-containing protein